MFCQARTLSAQAIGTKGYPWFAGQLQVTSKTYIGSVALTVQNIFVDAVAAELPEQIEK